MLRAYPAVQSPTVSWGRKLRHRAPADPLNLTFSLLRRAGMPFRIREMRSAKPQPALFTMALARLVTRFVHARYTLAHLFFRFNACRIHGVLQITKGGSSVRGISMRGFHDPYFIHAAARNIHPAVGSCRQISHRSAAGRNIRPRRCPLTPRATPVQAPPRAALSKPVPGPPQKPPHLLQAWNSRTGHWAYSL